MRFRTLIFRSLRHRWRTHLGVILGAVIGSAALIGALIVGDSVRESLRHQALQRLGGAELVLDSGDRFFDESLAERIRRWSGFVPDRARTNRIPTLTGNAPVTWTVATNVTLPPPGVIRPKHADMTVLLRLPAVASRQDGEARANRVQVWGVKDFWLFARPDEIANDPGRAEQWRKKTDLSSGEVALNETLAAQLSARPGDTVILRIHKPSALSRDAVITPRDETTVALRVRVTEIVDAEHFGNLNLQSSQAPPANAFVRFDELAATAGVPDRANVLLAAPMRQNLPLSRIGRLKLQANKVLARISPRLQLQRRIQIDSISGTDQLVHLQRALAGAFLPEDAEANLHLLTNAPVVELNSRRIFLDEALATAAMTPASNPVSRASSYEARFGSVKTNGMGILTYLANLIMSEQGAAPYSMITAAGPPYTAPDMRDDEILLNEWLAQNLNAKVGDTVRVSYYLADTGSQLVERTNSFRVRAIVPLAGIYADRTLMPEFPGLAKAESTHDWDAGFPLVHKIRDEDEAYWKQHRGTPKAFVTLAAGQQLWANRFGNLTAVRWTPPENASPIAIRGLLYENLRATLDPNLLGFRFEPIRAHALRSASNAQDFGQLFLGFSFFLIVAAIILMALLFQFGLEERTEETGVLLALGFTPRRVRRVLLCEGAVLSIIGGVLGVIAGTGFARLMLLGLSTLWRDAVGSTRLDFFVTAQTLLIGFLASGVIGLVTIAIVLRKQARQPARELLATARGVENEASSKRGRTIVVGAFFIAGAAIMIGAAFLKGDAASPHVFFGAGALMLVAGIAFASALLRTLTGLDASEKLSVVRLGLRAATRRRKRSLATVTLLASGAFMVIAVSANRLDADSRPERRSSGTGGFALIGETALPVVQDLNSSAGQEFFGLSPQELQSIFFVPMRVKGADEASCLNLNLAYRPTLLGVSPEALAGRGAFPFAKAPRTETSPWLMLKADLGADLIPAIGDQNSIQWAMKKKVGDTLEYTDDSGQTFRVKIVASVANSILQGKLLIDEARFIRRFPNETGYRMFLIDVPSNRVAEVSGTLSRALQDVGLELSPAARLLAQFNAVQNTYLNTFQVLGGLGLLLGSLGLGVVVLRNALERRGELAVMQAVGFRRRSLHWLVGSENSGLLFLGLGIGIASAAVAVWPVLRSGTSGLPWATLALTMSGVLLFGFASAFGASWLAVKGRLLDALRNE